MLPRLYAILDRFLFPDSEALFSTAEELLAGGVTLLQYRDKGGNARQMLEQARELKRRLGCAVKLIMNDRADLCLAAGFDGVHIGQEDLSAEGVRKVIGDACGWACLRTILSRLGKLRRVRRTMLPSARYFRPRARPIQIRLSGSRASARQEP